MPSNSGSPAKEPTPWKLGRSKAGAKSPVEAPAAPNVIAAEESALTKVVMIPSKSVTFYPNDKRQQTYIVISNNSDRKVMFKMKSTRPGVYKMKPVHGVINPSEKYSIRVAYMGIKVGHRIPVNDRITVVLAAVAQKGAEGDKKDVAEGEMRKKKLDVLFKGVNDQKAEPEGEGEKKPSAEKPADQAPRPPGDQKAYMNGYDEGYKAALIESTEAKGSAGPAKALERFQKSKGVKEPAFQEGFTEGYKKATVLLKSTEKKDVQESAEKPDSKETKAPSKEPVKPPSKEPVKALSKEDIKAPSKELVKPPQEVPVMFASEEVVKAPPKETAVPLIQRLIEFFFRIKSKEKAKPSKKLIKAPSKEKARPIKKVVKPKSKEPVKAPSKEVVKAPSKEPLKPVEDKATKKVKEPAKEPVKQPSKEPVKPPSKEPVKEPEKVKEEVKKEEVKEVKKEEKVEKEVKPPSDGTNVMAMTPGGTDPALADPLKKQEIVHMGPTGKKQVVIMMYRDPAVPENLTSRSGDEDEDNDDNMPSEPSQPPQPPQEPQQN
ncbi:hypothetical protein Aduo_003230 [Ancylostoma duodenale]